MPLSENAPRFGTRLIPRRLAQGSKTGYTMPMGLPTQEFDIVIVAQAGRLTYEAVLFVASLRRFSPDFMGKIYVAEPLPGPRWPRDPRIEDDAARDLLRDMGATIVGFDNLYFGARYPHGNKVEALAALPPDRPFLYFDTDTLITGPVNEIPFDFNRPSASMARSNSWPEPPLYGPGYTDIWRAVYDRFKVPFEPTLDLSEPDEHWQRYLYFNAGWFFHSDPNRFHKAMVRVMTSLRDDPLPELLPALPTGPARRLPDLRPLAGAQPSWQVTSPASSTSSPR